MEHNDYGRSVAEHVSHAIDKSGLSLREVADRSGIALATLHRKKSGLGKPFDVAELFAVAKALDLPASALYPAEVA